MYLQQVRRRWQHRILDTCGFVPCQACLGLGASFSQVAALLACRRSMPWVYIFAACFLFKFLLKSKEFRFSQKFTVFRSRISNTLMGSFDCFQFPLVLLWRSSVVKVSSKIQIATFFLLWERGTIFNFQLTKSTLTTENGFQEMHLGSLDDPHHA